MTNQEIEPFLNPDLIQFKSIFTLIDPALNTSEINPIHLQIPKVQRQKIASPTVETKSQVAKQKLLSPKLLQNQTPNKQEVAIVESKAKEISEPEKAVPVSPAVKQSPPVSKINQVNSQAYSPNWNSPLSNNFSAVYTVKMEGKTVSLIDSQSELVLQVKLGNSGRNSPLEIFNNSSMQVGCSKTNPANHSFFVGCSDQPPALETCAVMYNPMFLNGNQPRVFDFLIPALKKSQGGNHMFPIPFGESSGLITRFTQMSKEAIKLKTRIPPNKDNQFDMTFDNRFQIGSLTNFVLFHESNIRNDLCLFSYVKENQYQLTVKYPLAPVQGFLAAVASIIPV